MQCTKVTEAPGDDALVKLCDGCQGLVGEITKD